MISRTRLLITAALLCHLLLAPPLVTSQLLSPTAAQGQEVTIKALEQEKQGPVFTLRGQVEIHYRDLILYADEASYSSDSGDVTLDGHVVLDGGPNDEHIQATHAEYNLRSQTGKLQDVIGTIGVHPRTRQLLLTSPTPFAFTGKLVEKTGPEHYVVHDGSVTSCELPHPKWRFSAHRVTMELGRNAVLYNSTFRLFGVPVLFLPFATHPLQPLPRQSGFLIPHIGTSNIKGKTIGESFYWAINRSMDATLGAEFFSRRGWAQHGEFRARPSETSYADLTYFGVVDRGIGSPPVGQGGQDVRLKSEGRFGHNFRGVANIEYLSSFVFRLAFNEVFAQAVNSEVKSQAFLSNTTHGFSYNALAQRYQNFESTNKGDVITIVHVPTVNLSSVERRLGRSPLFWSFDSQAEGLSRSEPSFRTGRLLGRFDFSPSLSLPLLFHGWSLRPEVGVRDTFYTQQLAPSNGVGVAADNPINRRAAEFSFELRPPALERVFQGSLFGSRIKHVVEPRIIYRRVTGVNNFANILRFDERDILSDTNEVEYSLVNRVYAKPSSALETQDCGVRQEPGGAGSGTPPWEEEDGSVISRPCAAGTPARELFSWELAQKYFLDPNFGGALVDGRRNVLTTTADFTAIAFLTSPRHLSPLLSRLRVGPTSRIDASWDLDYDFKGGRINASTATLSYRVGQVTFAGSDAYLQSPGEVLVSNNIPTPAKFHQFRLMTAYGSPTKAGWSGAAAVGFDVNVGFLQYSAVQTTYNWDCCGFSVEFRRFALGSVRNENQYRFTLSLANLGTFGNIRRQERLY
jgi:LPS-assembly protein